MNTHPCLYYCSARDANGNMVTGVVNCATMDLIIDADIHNQPYPPEVQTFAFVEAHLLGQYGSAITGDLEMLRRLGIIRRLRESNPFRLPLVDWPLVKTGERRFVGNLSVGADWDHLLTAIELDRKTNELCDLTGTPIATAA